MSSPHPSLSLPRPLPAVYRRGVVLAALGAVLMALCAQVHVPMGIWGVPFTLQASCALFLGAALGGRAALGAVATYLTAGLMGAPVFAGAQAGAAVLFGPRIGFFAGFLLAAAWLGAAPRPIALWRWVGGALAVLGCGFVGLWPWLGARGALAAGVTPFLVAEVAKAAALWAGSRLMTRGG